jgi:outer membrane protein
MRKHPGYVSPSGGNTCMMIPMVLFLGILSLHVHSQNLAIMPAEGGHTSARNLQKLSLAQCMDSALANNRFRPASQQGIRIAEAQHKQALSGYWPQLSAQLSYVRLDQDPNFVMPPGVMNLQVPVLGSMAVDVPAQDITVMDKLNGLAKLELQYPVYTGGLISAMVRQARQAVEIANIESRRTDLQIRYDVKRMYYGLALSRNLIRIGRDALSRLEATLLLTENLYQKGSGKVKKTDFLKNKIFVETVRSMVQTLEQNEKTAKAALINTMGLSWTGDVDISDEEIPFDGRSSALASLVENANTWNPDVAKVNAGLAALDARRDQARSAYYPHVAIIGNISHTENSWDYGFVSSRMKDSWMVGVGVQCELFAGFRTGGEVEEATARIRKLQDEQVLLQEGLALQIQQISNQVAAFTSQEASARETMKTAIENRELTERAYESDLLEVKDLIEAQLIESFAQAQYQKTRYDHYEAQARLEMTVGSSDAPSSTGD